MAPVGFIADVNREVATLEPDVAIAADGLGIAASVAARAGDLRHLAAGVVPFVMLANALAALTGTAVLA